MICQARYVMGRLITEVKVRSLGKWGISRLYSGVSGQMSLLSIGVLLYRESNAIMRTVSGARYPIIYRLLFDLVLATYLCCFEM